MQVGFAPIYSLDPVATGELRRQYGVAVLSRFPVLEFTNHDVTRLSTQTADPVPAPTPGFAGMVVQAQGARVHVYLTHLDYRADPALRIDYVAVSPGVQAVAARVPDTTLARQADHRPLVAGLLVPRGVQRQHGLLRRKSGRRASQ